MEPHDDAREDLPRDPAHLRVATSSNHPDASLQQLDQIDASLIELEKMPVADRVQPFSELQERLTTALAGTAPAGSMNDPADQPGITSPRRPDALPYGRSG